MRDLDASSAAKRAAPGRWMLLLAGALVPLTLVAPALAEEASYIGSEVCVACHKDQSEGFARTLHGRLFNEKHGFTAEMKLGCEACHGPASAHVEAAGGKGVGGLFQFDAEASEDVERINGACLGCHSGAERIYWQGSTHHTRGLACTTCHSVHEARSEHAQLKGRTEAETCGRCHLVQRASQFRNARMPLREGHMSCTSCHNSHGTVTEALISHISVNDGCLSCHADKRGPFMWEHPPVTESCLTCHTPHGSTRRAMLKLNPPRLCQQCHAATGHPSSPRSPDDRFVAAGSCLNCHANIHGSNHAAGFIFSR
jgi:DmsE family decaheme c-type cytochrome